MAVHWDATRGVHLAYHSSSLAGPRISASVHQCISAPESRGAHAHPPRQVAAASAQGLSSTPLLCCCCYCPSQLAPPPVPPPPRATWHLVSAHVPGRVTLPGVPGLLTRTQCQTQPTGDFPDPPKRPPARPSYPVHCVITTSSLPPEQSPCIPYQETTHHSALPRTPVSLPSLWHFLLSKSPERDRVLDCACASECDCDCAILTD